MPLTLWSQSRRQIAELSVLCKTWGLLKYYHPEIATGKHDWDSVLIVSVKQSLNAKDNAQFVWGVNKMMAIAGKDTAAAYHPVYTLSIHYRNYDPSWIDKNSLLSPEIKSTLKYIAGHPYRGLNYYAQPNPDNDGNVFTPNEKPYAEMLYPDVYYRLLGLFRYWNVINYFYPYKYAIGKPWEDLLTEMIPLMINATDTLSYHKALARMAAVINDSHGGLWPQVYLSIAGKYSPAFNFRLVDNKAVVTRLADSMHSPVKVGSVIETMDAVSVKQRIKTYWDYIPASNKGGKLKVMHEFIFNSKVKQAVITGYQPDGRKFKATIPLKERDLLKDYLDFFEMTSPVTAEMIMDNIGYVFFSNVNRKNLDSVMAPLMHTKAIVFDMRNYPQNGSGTYHIPDYLLSKPTIYAHNTSPDFDLPGMMKYEVSNKGTSAEQVGKHNPAPYQGKIILLVDERTQSAAEWACMTLKTAPNVTVIGSQTAGADGNVTRTVLPGNYKINFSGLGIYFPDGGETQRIGIPIDIPVRYTISDMMYKNDPLLKKAIEFINNH